MVTAPGSSRFVAAEPSAPRAAVDGPPVEFDEGEASLVSDPSSSRPVGACFVADTESESDDNAKPRDVGVSPIVKSSTVDSSPDELDTAVSNGWNPVVAEVMISGRAFWVVLPRDPGSENLGAPISILLAVVLVDVRLVLDAEADVVGIKVTVAPGPPFVASVSSVILPVFEAPGTGRVTLLAEYSGTVEYPSSPTVSIPDAPLLCDVDDPAGAVPERLVEELGEVIPPIAV